MVRREQAWTPQRPRCPVEHEPRTAADRRRPRSTPRPRPTPTSTTPRPARSPAIADPSLWDPVPVTLPTYVTKPAAARRTVRTIDLDSTGVWTSGRTEADSQLAREADARRRAPKRRRRAAGHRAVGS